MDLVAVGHCHSMQFFSPIGQFLSKTKRPIIKPSTPIRMQGLEDLLVTGLLATGFAIGKASRQTTELYSKTDGWTDSKTKESCG